MTTASARRAPNTVRGLLISVIALFALAGCTPTGEAEPSETAGGTLGESSEGEGFHCLVGNWFIEEDQLDSFYEAMDLEGVDFDVDGGTGLSFTESRYKYTPEFTLNMITSGVTAEGNITGSITGDYSVTEGVIITENDTNDTNLVITASGIEFDGSGLFDDLLSSAPINSAPFECSDRAPIIRFETGGSSRVPIHLTARGESGPCTSRCCGREPARCGPGSAQPFVQTQRGRIP